MKTNRTKTKNRYLGSFVTIQQVSDYLLSVNFFDDKIDAGDFELTGKHPYRSERQLLWTTLRWKNKNTGEKIIKNVHSWDFNWFLGKPEYGDHHPVYRLPYLTTYEVGPILICEGENCVDAAVKLGINATTSFGGCTNVHNTDWSSVGARHAQRVWIWPDNDTDGIKYMQNLIPIFYRMGCQISLLNGLTRNSLPEGGDIIDFIAENPGCTYEDIERLMIRCNDKYLEKYFNDDYTNDSGHP